ncbi:MAG: hypothetical protein ABS898_06355, partial [Psychrobacillus sp.]
KWVKAPVAEELPPRFLPFACRGRHRRLRFSCVTHLREYVTNGKMESKTKWEVNIICLTF